MDVFTLFFFLHSFINYSSLSTHSSTSSSFSTAAVRGAGVVSTLDLVHSCSQTLFIYLFMLSFLSYRVPWMSLVRRKLLKYYCT